MHVKIIFSLSSPKNETFILTSIQNVTMHFIFGQKCDVRSGVLYETHWSRRFTVIIFWFCSSGEKTPALCL